ncbi:hypothetical protein SOVF_171040, partial [Spinacia oleracea]
AADQKKLKLLLHDEKLIGFYSSQSNPQICDFDQHALISQMQLVCSSALQFKIGLWCFSFKCIFEVFKTKIDLLNLSSWFKAHDC